MGGSHMEEEVGSLENKSGNFVRTQDNHSIKILIKNMYYDSFLVLSTIKVSR
jgi:hypothetical protein